LQTRPELETSHLVVDGATTVAVAEPATLSLLGMAVVALAARHSLIPQEPL